MNIDLTSPVQLKELLRRHNFYARKRYGQNFLVDRNIVNKILDAADISEGDPVLEIGPGVGTLTQAIAQRGAYLVAVEIDRDVIPILEESLAGLTNVKVVHADILSLSLPDFLREHFGDAKVKVLGNLPYYITSPIIAQVIETRGCVERLVMMVQKEVADRIKASPGTKDFGSMSVFVQYHAAPEIIAQVSRNVFLPPPDVTSAVMRLTPLAQPPVTVPSEKLFFDVVHSAFGQRRKTLLNSLSDTPSLCLTKEKVSQVLHTAGIDPKRRAETLSLEEFALISRSIG